MPRESETYQGRYLPNTIVAAKRHVCCGLCTTELICVEFSHVAQHRLVHVCAVSIMKYRCAFSVHHEDIPTNNYPLSSACAELTSHMVSKKLRRGHVSPKGKSPHTLCHEVDYQCSIVLSPQVTWERSWPVLLNYLGAITEAPTIGEVTT